MPPKGKKNKKQEDDWETEALGDAPDPIAAATAEDKATEADADEDGATGGGGGMLAALRKNKERRAKKGKPVQNDFIDGEDPAANGDGAGTPSLADKAPEEADADDLFAAQVKTKGGKGAKQPAKAAAKAADDDNDDEDAEDGGRVKTKKEKEKEKKEREKQRKKEQAAKKKTAAPAKPEKPEPVKEETAAEAAPEPTPVAAAAAAAAAAAQDGKGGKKVPAHVAALQKKMEQRRKLEEEQAKLKAAEDEREREASRLDEEKSKAEAEAKARKKEREKEKKEELRKQGLLLTKAQRDAKKAADVRRQQMIESGAVIEGLEGLEAAQKKKPSYDKKKKAGATGPSKAEEEARRLEEAKKVAEAEAEKLAAEREAKRQEEERLAAEEAAAIKESDAEEDWEAAADADDDVKESWDAETDEEAETAGKTNGKSADAKAQKSGSVAAKKAASLPVRTAAKKAADSDSDSEDDSSEEEGKSATQLANAKRKAEAAARRKQAHEDAMAARSKENLRSPICCILGHVDTGKTKLLDKIRQTNVQEGEAGGITQQIGATFFPVESLQQKTAVVNKDDKFEFKIPGLLIIDTPGHESFTNLRSRGSSLCNIAILVVDIMHGLEPQTLESMRLLRDRKTPFIVALNKIDRLYGWRKIDNNGFQDSLALQNKAVQQEFKNRLEQTKLAFAEQSFNAELFYENKSMARNVSLVPTSAHTGEGIPDMIKLITQLTQERMTGKLMYLSEVECTVLEVKVIEGLGTTIDVVLSNGVLREGDRVVLCGLNGPISTNIRALLTPQPMKELRVKSNYVHHQEVKASLGVKIAANDLEHAIAGSRLLVVGPDDDEEDLEEEVMSDIENLLNRVSKTGRGVSVQASTLGSLEALLEFLKVSKIPVANISIGPVFKRDVMQAGIMLEKAREYAVMLCFDVKVDAAAAQYAEEVGVKIFQADIIYHLFDNFTAHMAQLSEQRKEESKMLAVFPCVLKPVAVFNKKDPIVIGVDVVEGSLRPLTPIAVVKNNPVTNVKEIISIGRVSTVEREHKQIPICKKGQPSVAVKIEGPNQPSYGRQLEESDTLYSLISRASIDTLKEFYRADVSNEEWALIKKLKPLFDIA